MYEDLKNVNIDLIPPGFKTPFRGDKIQKCGDDGFLCEVRLKVEVETVLVTGLCMVKDYSIKYCWDFSPPPSFHIHANIAKYSTYLGLCTGEGA